MQKKPETFVSVFLFSRLRQKLTFVSVKKTKNQGFAKAAGFLLQAYPSL